MKLKLYACVYAFSALTNMHPVMKVNNQKADGEINMGKKTNTFNPFILLIICENQILIH